MTLLNDAINQVANGASLPNYWDVFVAAGMKTREFLSEDGYWYLEIRDVDRGMKCEAPISPSYSKAFEGCVFRLIARRSNDHVD